MEDEDFNGVYDNECVLMGGMCFSGVLSGVYVEYIVMNVRLWKVGALMGFMVVLWY